MYKRKANHSTKRAARGGRHDFSLHSATVIVIKPGATITLPDGSTIFAGPKFRS